MRTSENCEKWSFDGLKGKKAKLLDDYCLGLSVQPL